MCGVLHRPVRGLACQCVLFILIADAKRFVIKDEVSGVACVFCAPWRMFMFEALSVEED
jgi:hypothetical protein